LIANRISLSEKSGPLDVGLGGQRPGARWAGRRLL